MIASAAIAPSAGNTVAVLLNANAKRVSHRVHAALRHVVPDDDLFLSRSTSEARLIARTVVGRRYRTVFTGGGDGTFVSFVTEILDFLRDVTEPLPRFGVLKLGTGNALAGMVGATPGVGILDDVLRARAGQVPSVKRIDLLQAEGRIAPFAGVGLDAALLNDYVALKHRLGDGPLKRWGTGAPGYAMAVLSRTLPNYLRRNQNPEIEVVNGRGTAVLLDADGKPCRDIGPGELLYRGPAQMCAASTVPYYGFNIKMFPFAGSVPGTMQLRISNVRPLTSLLRVGSVWNGTMRHRNLHDFLAEEVTVRSKEKMPLQVGGDAEGFRDEYTFRLAPRQVELVDYSSV